MRKKIARDPENVVHVDGGSFIYMHVHPWMLFSVTLRSRPNDRGTKFAGSSASCRAQRPRQQITTETGLLEQGSCIERKRLRFEPSDRPLRSGGVDVARLSSVERNLGEMYLRRRRIESELISHVLTPTGPNRTSAQMVRLMAFCPDRQESSQTRFLNPNFAWREGRVLGLHN